VFVSLTHLERLFSRLIKAEKENNTAEVEKLKSEIKLRKIKGNTTTNFSAYEPTYFNTGCCCFDDGDITGIEIADGFIRLIKWEYNKVNITERLVLEELQLTELFKNLLSKNMV
jgi:hypothetical protein